MRLRLSPGATQKDVKSGFGRLALQVYGIALLNVIKFPYLKEKEPATVHR